MKNNELLVINTMGELLMRSNRKEESILGLESDMIHDFYFFRETTGSVSSIK